ncbi:NYN domain-containing protein [Mesobacillus sp. S13]|uniref:NYN domain-containing protein n=1 Tax=Mesobacillus sp. S13 TaxID=2880221 RepID=UPI001CF361E2|nr:NYN domain-containing protein [Mesobacillus sp. S13]
MKNRAGVFIDHENIRIRLEKLSPKKDIYDNDFIDKLRENLKSKGYINQSIYAYDDYLNSYFNKKQVLHHYKVIGINPVHTLNIKDSADLELSLDALEKCINDEFDIFFIVSCDKDMLPLIKKLKEKSKKVILVGLTFNSSNHVINLVDEFIPIEEIMGLPFDEHHLIKNDIIRGLRRCKDLFDWSTNKGKDLGKEFLIQKIKETLYCSNEHSLVIIEKLITNGILTEYQYTYSGKTVDGIKYVENATSTAIINGGIPNFN